MLAERLKEAEELMARIFDDLFRNTAGNVAYQKINTDKIAFCWTLFHFLQILSKGYLVPILNANNTKKPTAANMC